MAIKDSAIEKGHLKELMWTNLPLPVHKKGKVRDVYELGDDLLIVATDRISTFDHKHPNGIPEKGKILTALSLFWFNFLEHHEIYVDNHLISSDLPRELREYKDDLEGRVMQVKKAKPIPIECIVRGYLYGSGWRDYKKSGEICGIKLPIGLRMAEKLDEPIFTPSTKGKKDINISFEQAIKIVGRDTMKTVRDYSLEIYQKAHDYAREECGIIIADTKFEFGIRNGKIIIIDELFTPDASRFWCCHQYEQGKEQVDYDKQYVRNYVKKIREKHQNKKPSDIVLPENVVRETNERYKRIYERLTGEKWESAA